MPDEEARAQRGGGEPGAGLDERLTLALLAHGASSRKFAVYAERAEAQGFPEAARMFRAGEAAEGLHAKRILKATGSLGLTAANLQDAAHDLRSRSRVLRDDARQAESEGDVRAKRAFDYASKGDDALAQMLEGGSRDVISGQDAAVGPLYVCRVCGYLAEDMPPDECPVCGAGARYFSLIE